MKRLLYLGSIALLLTSFGIAGGRTYAAHSAAPPPPPGGKLTLHLCMSFPFGVAAYTDLANGMRRGIQLANGQLRKKMATVGIALGAPRAFDDARSDGVDYGTDQERQNALNCLADQHAIAYMGTLNSGATAISEPILNKAGMVMVSPANTSPTLTDPALRASHEPATLSHKFKYLTFYRTVTTDSLQGPAGAAYFKKTLHVNSYFLIDDKQTYGAGLAAKFDRYAKNKLSMTQSGIGHVDPTSAASIAETADAVADQVLSRKPQAVYYGGNPPQGGPLLRRLRAKGFTGPFLGGDALFNQAFITTNGASTANAYTTSVGPDPLKASAGFRSAYKKAFPGKALGPYDAPAYDAALATLQAIYRAKSQGKLTGGIANMRHAILPYMSATKIPGATGVTTFDRNGDTTNRIISIYGVTGSSWKFKGQAPSLGILPVP
jgi:branched-chain amino acid transport system substrate-binding protein